MATPDKTAGGTQIKPFASYLTTLDKAAHDEASRALHEVTMAVQATGGNGKVVVEITLKPGAKNNTDVLAVLVAVKKTVPSPAKPKMMHVGRDGNLQRDDPNMDTFDGLEVVGTRKAGGDA